MAVTPVQILIYLSLRNRQFEQVYYIGIQTFENEYTEVFDGVDLMHSDLNMSCHFSNLDCHLGPEVNTYVGCDVTTI